MGTIKLQGFPLCKHTKFNLALFGLASSRRPHFRAVASGVLLCSSAEYNFTRVVPSEKRVVGKSFLSREYASWTTFVFRR
jgi:hypothetical protein